MLLSCCSPVAAFSPARNPATASCSVSSCRAAGAALTRASATCSRSARCWASSRPSTVSPRSAAYRGSTEASTSATGSGAPSRSASRNRRAAGIAASAGCTTGSPSSGRPWPGGLIAAPGAGRNTAGWPAASNGGTWRPSASRMIGAVLAGPAASPAAPGSHRSGCRYRNPYSSATHSCGWPARNSAVSPAVNDSGVISSALVASSRNRHSRGVASADTAALASSPAGAAPGGRLVSRACSPGSEVSASSPARAQPPPSTGSRVSRAMVSRATSCSPRSNEPGGNLVSSSGSASRTWAVSMPSSRRPARASGSSAAVCPARYWLTGSCSGTLSRAGVVRYGP